MCSHRTTSLITKSEVKNFYDKQMVELKGNIYYNTVSNTGCSLKSWCLCLCLPSPGTYAVMSVMIGGVTERLAPDSNFMMWDNVTNSSIIDTVTRDAERVKVAAAVTFMSGLFQVNRVNWSPLVIFVMIWRYINKLSKLN